MPWLNKHNVGGTRPPPFPLPNKYKYNMFDTTRVGRDNAEKGTTQVKSFYLTWPVKASLTLVVKMSEITEVTEPCWKTNKGCFCNAHLMWCQQRSIIENTNEKWCRGMTRPAPVSCPHLELWPAGTAYLTGTHQLHKSEEKATTPAHSLGLQHHDPKPLGKP